MKKENLKEEYYTVKSYKELLKLCLKLRNIDNERHTIYLDSEDLEKGNYKFPFSNFIIINNSLKLVGSLYAKMKDEEGNELTTWKTATLKITGNDNLFVDLNIENDSKDSHLKGQEVAVAVYGNNNIFLNCIFTSMQDTLFVGPLPDDLVTRYIDFLPDDERYYEGIATNYFKNCKISGTIDFIFGAGKVIFSKCDLITLFDQRKESYVVAPASSLKDNFGFFFNECSFIKGKNVEDDSTYLARPWRDFGKAVFYKCNYDTHIKEEGFSDWSDVNRTRTCRFIEVPLKKGRCSFIKNDINYILPSYYLDEIDKLENLINTYTY